MKMLKILSFLQPGYFDDLCRKSFDISAIFCVEIPRYTITAHDSAFDSQPVEHHGECPNAFTSAQRHGNHAATRSSGRQGGNPTPKNMPKKRRSLPSLKLNMSREFLICGMSTKPGFASLRISHTHGKRQERPLAFPRHGVPA